ncbi:hypothetical protein C2845_PM17G09140 [Panicum miliaceum]|uniref:VWFA domain-containing protein n=1 Tax=Panicum miliaceum TaxID=4540 RepID=A0A3L6Q2F8_PANMI|nr:hypothetical protein C2845_PM17G09140 [Panicum miliaceum]
MAAQPGDKVKLEAMISMETTSIGEFAVVVLVTAPPALVTEQSDAGAGARGVDLVAVLDISGGMNEDNRLERMKEAMFSVLDQLGEHDRLCILSFNDEVRTLTELRLMRDENWADARAKVEGLTAPAGGGANVKAATEEAAKILAERGEKEQRDRVGRVIFLSSGDEEDDAVADAGSSEKQNDANTSPDLPPDAFVLGADDKLSPLSFSAGNTSAAYAYVKDTVDKIQDAPGLTSVETALGVQIDLHAQDGVVVSSIKSGGHPVHVGPPAGPRSFTIYIQDLYAGEQKRFTVSLTVPEGKEELLAVTGRYSDPENSEDTQLDVCEIFVPRDEAINTQEETAPGENDQDMPDTPANGTAPRENQHMQDDPEETSPGEYQVMPAGVPEEQMRANILKKKEEERKLGKVMESAGITSCFNSALVADMCPAMNRYIYQAIVHGTGFQVPLLEHSAQMIEMEKLELHARQDQEYFYRRQGSEGDGNGWHQQGEE